MYRALFACEDGPQEHWVLATLTGEPLDGPWDDSKRPVDGASLCGLGCTQMKTIQAVRVSGKVREPGGEGKSVSKLKSIDRNGLPRGYHFIRADCRQRSRRSANERDADRSEAS